MFEDKFTAYAQCPYCNLETPLPKLSGEWYETDSMDCVVGDFYCVFCGNIYTVACELVIADTNSFKCITNTSQNNKDVV